MPELVLFTVDDPVAAANSLNTVSLGGNLALALPNSRNLEYGRRSHMGRNCRLRDWEYPIWRPLLIEPLLHALNVAAGYLWLLAARSWEQTCLA